MGYYSRMEVDYIQSPLDASTINTMHEAFCDMIAKGDKMDIIGEYGEDVAKNVLRGEYSNPPYGYEFESCSEGIYLDCDSYGKHGDGKELAIFISSICTNVVNMTFMGEDGTRWGWRSSPGKVEELIMPLYPDPNTRISVTNHHAPAVGEAEEPCNITMTAGRLAAILAGLPEKAEVKVNVCLYSSYDQTLSVTKEFDWMSIFVGEDKSATICVQAPDNEEWSEHE